MALIPVRLHSNKEVKLTAAGQNTLIKLIVEDFCARFTPGGMAGDEDDVVNNPCYSNLSCNVWHRNSGYFL